MQAKSTNGGREQSWIDQLQVPEEQDYINRLRAMRLDPKLRDYWIAMEGFRTQRMITGRALSTAKLTAAITTSGIIAGAVAGAVTAVVSALR